MRTSHWIGVISLLAAAGVVHGMWTHRWASSTAGEAGVNLLAKAEQPLAEWKPDAFVPISEEEIPKGATVFCRHFTNGKNNKRVVVSVTSGVPGVVAAHTPDVCFLGSGYKLKGPPTKQTLPLAGGGSAAFYMADFEKTSATGNEIVRCRWTWTADGTWHAPDYPRLFFAKSQLNMPVLYKLYIVHPLTDDDLTKSDAYRTFAADLASALSKQLAP